jgi:hypothetical protein
MLSLYAGLLDLGLWTLAFGHWSRRTLVAIGTGRFRRSSFSARDGARNPLDQPPIIQQPTRRIVQMTIKSSSMKFRSPRLSRHRGRRPAARIANPKARGVCKGRKATIDPAKIKQMKADGMGPSAIAKALKISRASVYRALSGQRQQPNFGRVMPARLRCWIGRGGNKLAKGEGKIRRKHASSYPTLRFCLDLELRPELGPSLFQFATLIRAIAVSVRAAALTSGVTQT